MNKHHEELLTRIKKVAEDLDKKQRKGYVGSGHRMYGLSNPQKRGICKQWKEENNDILVDNFIDLLDSLFYGESYDEKTLAGLLLGYMTRQRKKINPEKLDEWLEELEGWAEIDTLCQSTFTAKEFLSDWKAWMGLLRKFRESENISKRRASLVLLVKPIREPGYQKLVDLAFENINHLKSEDDKLITKAVSWLLREMTKKYRQQVEDYLDENEDSLPAVAVRETRRKLETGKK